MPFFDDLIRKDRKLELDYEFACTQSRETAIRVREIAARFLDGYVAFNRISQDAAIASYTATVKRYVKDIHAYVKTGKYPLQLEPNQPPLERTDYDLFLILTILTTHHRCAIMEELTRFPVAGPSLVIGVGSGIELNYIEPKPGTDVCEAFDLYINPYARTAFPHWTFREELYRPHGSLYQSIYAIELLEHLSDPLAFMADCHASLMPGGKVVTTIAVNVPQFDHTVNFPSEELFEAEVAAIGFKLDHKTVIPHAYPRMEINARNCFYVYRRPA